MPMKTVRLIEKASKELSAITGLDISTTLGVEKDNSHWKVTLEMIEKRAIPDQMDILGVYEVLVDEEGNLVSFKRKGLRKRMDTQESDEE
ncbi:gas vesicle protein [bacterium]|nr:gas vesicle protein [bacterium]